MEGDKADGKVERGESICPTAQRIVCFAFPYCLLELEYGMDAAEAFADQTSTSSPSRLHLSIRPSLQSSVVF